MLNRHPVFFGCEKLNQKKAPYRFYLFNRYNMLFFVNLKIISNEKNCFFNICEHECPDFCSK